MTSPAVDPSVLARLFADIGRDASVMRELVDTFLAQGPELVGAARSAASAGDWKTLHRAVHTLKSSALTFGATGLGTLCRALETEAMSGPVEGAPARVAAIEAEWARTADAIRAWPIPS